MSASPGIADSRGPASSTSVGRSGSRIRAAGRFLLVTLVASAGAARTAAGGSLLVRVSDVATGAPIGGAFVQVGPAPGDPFPSNWDWTDPRGRVAFADPRLTGPQTVTAAAAGCERQTAIDFAGDSIAFRLRPEVAPDGVPEPKIEVRGTVSGIAVQGGDGELDIGIVFPAIGLSDILQSRVLPFDAPPDTVRLPTGAKMVLPGNIVVPEQRERSSIAWSKPSFRLVVPAERSHDLFVLAGRLPPADLSGGGPPLNSMSMRKAGVVRGVGGPADLWQDLSCDLSLQGGVRVRLPEAPAGCEVFAAVIADLPGAGGARSVFLDAKSAIADTLAALQLAGLAPAGDLADAVVYLAGYYADSSSADLFQSGRVDRSPLALPAERALDGLFRVPILSQDGEDWCWTDGSRPGPTPRPTWAISTIRIGPEAPGASGVTPRSLWEIWVPAGNGSFRLPILAPGAPGGIPETDIGSDQGRLYWDCWIADPAGPLSEVMLDPFATLTRWSRRTTPAIPPAASTESVAFGTLRPALRFRLVPNPGTGPRDVLLDSPLPAGETIRWSIVSPSGRKLARGSFTCQGSGRHAKAIQLPDELPAGVHWIRLESAGQSGTVPLVVVR